MITNEMLRWKKERILSRIKLERCADHYGDMATLIGAINDYNM